jgi:hypothetical protein
MSVLGHGPSEAAPLLQAEQDFGGHQRRQTDEADLAGAADRRLSASPTGLAELRVLTVGRAPALLVRPAVDAFVMSPRARARRHEAEIVDCGKVRDVGGVTSSSTT